MKQPGLSARVVGVHDIQPLEAEDDLLALGVVPPSLEVGEELLALVDLDGAILVGDDRANDVAD